VPDDPITFTCNACGLTLAVDPRLAGVSGPCPACGVWITSPAAGIAKIPQATPPAKIPVRKSGPKPLGRAKGRIPPDSIVDQAHFEQRESAKTLKVLALFVLAACACLAAAWFLKDWIGK
jgi:ribosomal protein S27E